MSRRSEPAMSDADWEAACKTLYERKRFTGAKLRKAEAKRRKANEPPLTLLEALERHLRAKPRARINTLTLPHTPPQVPPQLPPHDSLGKLAALFADDPVLAELGEAAALTPEERFRLHGWLVGVPYDVLGKLPAHMLADDYRWELPTWALAAKYDALREDYFLELIDLRLDKAHADKLLSDRKYAAKSSTRHSRSMRPDEWTLPAEQKAHLKKLRARLANARDILRTVEGASVPPEHVTRARSYVASSVAAIAAARAAYGLPEVETV